MNIVEWYRDQLTGYAAAQRWTVTEEPTTDDRDCRLEIRQGALSTPVILYHTGRIVVQGKAHELRERVVELSRQLEVGTPILPADPLLAADQALEELQHLSDFLPTLDPMVVQLVKEAVLTHQHQACLATAFLLGAASERLILQLIEAFALVLPDSERLVYARRLEQHRGLAKRWDIFRDAWNTSAFRKQAPYDLDAEITQTFQFTRLCRNEVGHPQLPPRFDCATLRANLAYFRHYLTAVQGLIETCQALPS